MQARTKKLFVWVVIASVILAFVLIDLVYLLGY
jgi:hypothetical protein